MNDNSKNIQNYLYKTKNYFCQDLLKYFHTEFTQEWFVWIAFKKITNWEGAAFVGGGTWPSALTSCWGLRSGQSRECWFFLQDTKNTFWILWCRLGPGWQQKSLGCNWGFCLWVSKWMRTDQYYLCIFYEWKNFCEPHTFVWMCS